MKQFFTLVSLILLNNTLLTGQYIPFVEEGKFWIYLNYANPDLPNPYSGHAITFLGDTTINSKAYKKVIKLNLKGGHDCPPADMPCWDFDYPYQTESRYLDGFIREDVLEKKIYMLKNSNTGEEELLFDFSLNVGDTLNEAVYESILASYTNLYPGGIVDSIKAIDVYGKLRNSIFTYGFNKVVGLPYETEIAIAEGLGFVDYGVFYEVQSLFADYCEGAFDQCDLILSNEFITVKQEVKVYPNPSNGVFQIETKEDVKELRVYSIQGQLKTKAQFTNEIDLSDFESGIYLLEIITENDEIIIKKIKKEG